MNKNYIPVDSDYLKMNDGMKIRLGNIITINGKPGLASDEYNSYGNAFVDCMVGTEN